MRNEAVWAIRDARGLNQDEKALLWAIESRGTAKVTWHKLADDAGMAKNRFYRTRTALIQKSLINVSRLYDSVSEYKVNLEALAEWSNDSHSGNEVATDSHSGNKDSHSGNEDSHYGETKKNIKKNTKKKVTSKKKDSAGALVETSLPKDEVPEDESSFEEDSPLKKKSEPDSHSGNEFDERTPADWREIRSQRPLTQQENDYINARATAYMATKRAEEDAARKEEVW
jgi:hypothetical protein